jgi:hypothetical protein
VTFARRRRGGGHAWGAEAGEAKGAEAGGGRWAFGRGRHLMAGHDLSPNQLYGHVVARKGRTGTRLARYLRSLHPAGCDRVMDNYSAPHPVTRVDSRVGTGPETSNVELAYVPFTRLLAEPDRGAQFTSLRYFALDGTDHPGHPREQANVIRRYVAWRNRHITDPRLPQGRSPSQETIKKGPGSSHSTLLLSYCCALLLCCPLCSLPSPPFTGIASFTASPRADHAHRPPQNEVPSATSSAQR